MDREARDSRGSIATAALVEFAEFGFDGARIARIAGRAQVNKQLLYYYFGSKTELYSSVVRDIADALGSQIRGRLGTDNPVERIRARSSAVFHYLATSPDRTRIVLAGISDHRDVVAPIRSAVRDLVSQLQKEISAAQGMGYFRDDVDPARAAAQAVTLLLGYFSLTAVLDQAAHESWPADWIQSANDLLARSLSW